MVDKQFLAEVLKETYAKTVKDNELDMKINFRHFAKLCTLLMMKGEVTEEELQILYKFDRTDDELKADLEELEELHNAKKK